MNNKLGYKVAKHTQEHIKAVSQQYGLSAVTVEAVIDAYIADMCETLHNGMNVNIPHLVSIGVKPDDSGGYQTYSAVSKVLRMELRGADYKPRKAVHRATEQTQSTPINKPLNISESLLAGIDLGIPGLKLGG